MSPRTPLFFVGVGFVVLLGSCSELPSGDANRRPVANISANVTSGPAPLSVTLDGGGSLDPDGRIVAYRWTSSAGDVRTGMRTSMTFASLGQHTVTLEVEDDDGGTGQAELAVTVTDANAGNLAPVAYFTAVPRPSEISMVPVTIQVDAGASRDDDGSIVSYAWSTSDGQTASGVTAAFTFEEAGQYTVTLKVTDNSGAEDSYVLNFQFFDDDRPDNLPPLATFSAVPDSGTAPLSVSVDASGSGDPDGTIASYRWTSTEGHDVSGPTLTSTVLTFETPGEHEITLVVTDDEGATGSFSVPVTVAAANQPPTADFTATPGTGAESLTVALDASASADADGAIVAYNWSSSAGHTASGVTASMTFAAAGTYTITLEVVDDAGGSSSATQSVTVSAPPPPPASTYRIDLIFSGSGFTESRRAVFADAAARWSEVVLGDLADLPSGSVDCRWAVPSDPGYTGTIDDVVISAIIETIDGIGGILGQAGPCYVRGSGSGLPYYGIMRFDSADVSWLESSGQLRGVILHEMGHVMGIGTVWETDGHDLLNYSGSDCLTSSTPPTFFGQAGMGAYGDLGASGEVPVEDNGLGGTGCVHWDEEIFGDELMTGYIGGGMSLSRLTAGSLADLGYAVDQSAADAYAIPGCSPNCLRTEAEPVPHSELILPR